MTIDGAIKELKAYNSKTFEVSFVSFSEALKLGIEALERVLDVRCFPDIENWKPLPRETKD